MPDDISAALEVLHELDAAIADPTREIPAPTRTLLQILAMRVHAAIMDLADDDPTRRTEPDPIPGCAPRDERGRSAELD